MTNQFTLLDLDSQSQAVATQIRGFTADRILAWLAQHGTVERCPSPMWRDMYLFTSGVGVRTVFRLTDDGRMYILYEHTARPLETD